jgi:hypothetical protein
MIHPARQGRLPDGTTPRIHYTDGPEQLAEPEKWIDKPHNPLQRFWRAAHVGWATRFLDRARACGLDLLRKVVGQHTLDQALSETTSRARESEPRLLRHKAN